MHKYKSLIEGMLPGFELKTPDLYIYYGGRDRYSIVEPSGPKITASKLKAGKCYFYRNPYKYRRLTHIVRDRAVYDEDKGGYGSSCSTSHFARVCPYEMTDAEVYFMDNYNPY